MVVVHVEADADLPPLSVAKTFKALAEKEKPDLILLGKQAIDTDASQTGAMLGGLLKWPTASFISQLKPDGDSFNIERETDVGIEVLKVSSPAVMTVDLRLNEPRYATLPNIMKAKKKPVESFTLADLQVTPQKNYSVVSVEDPPSREAGIKVPDTASLFDKLKNEAKVL